MARPSKYPQELRERAIRMVAEMLPSYGSEYEAIRTVASKLGIGTPESLRKWIRQSQVDGGQRPGVTTEESAEIKRLKRENAELRRANQILKSAASFSDVRGTLDGHDTGTSTPHDYAANSGIDPTPRVHFPGRRPRLGWVRRRLV